ncbi:hypothetical protein [Spirosoma validum]|uniref:Uncharacterized protein n=1 Tax=Spirosoma validum TaxID=2771355 RepID=A0A927B314_9BACT|nr:hypothetical protein [Spirosoma validum]MBD2754671.1 hypothetical protein [Spirosoma validum]
MKKHTEKQPIDNLFARKLSNMSLPPNADGFERLQARMGQNKPEARIVFWRNPVVQRYMAAAACLVLLCSLGWLYWPSGAPVASNESQVAVNQNVPVRPEKAVVKQSNPSASTLTPATGIAPSSKLTIDQQQLAKVEKASGRTTGKVRSSAQPVNEKNVIPQAEMSVRSESVLAQTAPTEHKAKPESAAASTTPNNVAPVSQPTLEQVTVADNKPVVKSNPPAERVLVVTIEEPAALVAARQAAKTAVDEKSMVAATDKPEKETKEGGLWKQVKRFKQGELFARGDNANNDDRGLLSRAYDGLKHSLDKDKPAKQ